MEPRQGAPKLPYEGMPVNSGETQSLNGNQGELMNEGRFESVGERPAIQERENLPPVVPATPTAIPVAQDSANAQLAASDDAASGPAAAADEDLIEKEWVDRAKKIIEETKDDPYKRELEIGKLQRDYIMKRYGRVIGESSST